MKTLVFNLLFLLVASNASGQIGVIGALAHDAEATPGSSYAGTIELQNSGSEVRQAKLYQTDYSFSYDGSNYFDGPGSVARSNASWITFSPSFVTVPPGESVTVAYNVTVPPDSDSTLAGSYWSVLMVEDIPEKSPESTLGTNRDDLEIGLREVFRYAVQIATHIRTHEDYNIDFVGVGLVDGDSHSRALKVAVANSGNMFVRPSVWIEVFDGSGSKRRKIESKPARLYPATSVSHVFDMSEFESGEYEVLVVVDAGDDKLFGAQYTVSL